MEENNEESKFKKYLYNQGALICGILGVAFGIYFTFANPQINSDKILQGVQADLSRHEAVQLESDKAIADKLELIRQGDLKDLKADLLENRAEITQLKNEVVKLETILQERLPAN